MPEPAVTAPMDAQSAQPATAAIAPLQAGLIVLAGLLAAFLAAGANAGLGLSLSALAAVALVVIPTARDSFDRIAMAIAALILTATPLLRDADWLVALNLSLAPIFASASVAGSESWTAVVTGPIRAVQGLFAAPWAVLRSLVSAIPRSAGLSLASPLRGVALGSGLVLIFGLLFASADSAFSQLAEDLVPDETAFESVPDKIMIALMVIAITGSIVLLPGTMGERRVSAAAPFLRPSEWFLALGPVVILFCVFVAIQFTVLFGGNEHVLKTAGLTYSEYAREGFTQLLVVSVLALALVAAAWRWSETSSHAQTIALRLLLAAICALALVILVSALHRLDLYVDAFGATRPRVIAALACVWIAGILAMALVALVKWRSAWIPRAFMGFTAAMAVAFMMINPDARIAERNVDRFADEGKFDVAYNASLSADAVPAFLSLPSSLNESALAAQREELDDADGWRGFSLSRSAARDALRP